MGVFVSLARLFRRGKRPTSKRKNIYLSGDVAWVTDHGRGDLLHALVALEDRLQHLGVVVDRGLDKMLLRSM